mgnify:CR=1 FL=1
MPKLKDIVNFLDEILEIAKFANDHSNNGLQIEGNKEVKKAVFGVDACLKLFERCNKSGGNFVFVHHGLSWESNLRRITGYNARMISCLMQNQISLYAAHLPLDAHQKFGHNILISKELGLSKTSLFAKYSGVKIGVMGRAPANSTPAKFAKILDAWLDAKCFIYGNKNYEIRKVGVISGGAGQDGIEASLSEGLGCLVTGEVGHSSINMIEEINIPVISIGHYCSEKPGVFAVMEKIRAEFKIDVEFVTLPTGM